jgi:very-short-patch-repair endonuclease
MDGVGYTMKRQAELSLQTTASLGPFMLDFYCAKAKLCVEIDGPVHLERAENDQRRTAWLKEKVSGC